MVGVYTNMAGKTKYKEAHKSMFRIEKEKVRSMKYIALGLDKNMGDLVNEGVDYILEKYKQYIVR